jgi:cytoskeletal protein RodZ
VIRPKSKISLVLLLFFIVVGAVALLVAYNVTPWNPATWP